MRRERRVRVSNRWHSFHRSITIPCMGTSSLALFSRPASSGMSSTPRSGNSSRALSAISRAGNKLTSGFRSSATSAASLVRSNGALKAALANANPESLPAVAIKAAPELATNLVASAADETSMGKACEEMLGVKPSTIGLAVAALGVLALPRSMRGVKGKLAKVGLGLAHVVIANLGRKIPAAVSAGASAAKGAKTSGTDDESSDTES